MITVSEADQLISKNMPSYSESEISLHEAYGNVLKEDVQADRDSPPFHRALMDGIAIKYDTFEKGLRTFKVAGIQAAGQAQKILKAEDQCFEIMTGAVLPKGCDCIIPIEQVTIFDKEAILEYDLNPQQNQFIQPQGSYHHRGDTVLEKNSLLLPPQLATCAAVGKHKLKVASRPKVAVITTGDELVNVSQKNIKTFQIRKSNSISMQMAIEETGLLEAHVVHLKDNKKNMLKEIKEILKNFDVIVSSGGVSMGKFDYMPEVLKELGVKLIFHKVSQKPGKPFWFGVSRNKQPVFALPGNPLSSQIGVYKYVIPHMKIALGLRHAEFEHAILKEHFNARTDFTYFLPVKINCNELGQLIATPVDFPGSGDFAALAKTDGFIELPGEQESYESGFKARLFRWHENH